MRKVLLLIIVCISLLAQGQEYWKKQSPAARHVENLYKLDLQSFINKAHYAKQIKMPTSKGKFLDFKLKENPNFMPELAKKYPNIKSYVGYAEDEAELRLSVSKDNISGIVFSKNGGTEIIENQTGNLYQISTNQRKEELMCLTRENGIAITSGVLPVKTDGKIRNYRLALSVTGEYTQYFGGTKEKALAAINTSLTNVNAVLERELSVHLNLIGDNDKIIYTDAQTDPYSEAQIGTSGKNIWSKELQATLEKRIGEENYDLGHLLSSESGGGYAGGIATVCINGEKGSAYSAPYNGIPKGFNFDIDFITHEIGHQLGATHIHSEYEGTGTNVEPGSGSTIMGYAGIIGKLHDILHNSDHYFNQINILQINNTLRNKKCGTVTEGGGNNLQVDAGEDYIIPARTPFVLEGKVTNGEESRLKYTWEQADSSETDDYSLANPEATTGPLFRSIPPSESKERIFPAMQKIQKKDLYDRFEALPKVAREINFVFSARETNGNYGMIATDAMKVTVVDSEEGFFVKTPAALQTIESGTEIPIEWNVSNTNKAPINAQSVNIFLVDDEGREILLKENTPNDGSERVLLPKQISAKNAHVKVKPIGNIFFAISNDFPINYIAENVCHSYTPKENLPIRIPDGKSTIEEDYSHPALVTFEVPATGITSQVTLSVDVEHQRTSDLQLVLSSPEGKSVLLFANKGGKNISGTFSSEKEEENTTLFPPQSLNEFNETPPKGIWQLSVADGFRLDEGKIKTAQLNLCSVNYTKIQDYSTGTLNLYPNPAKEKLSVQINNLNETELEFSVYTLVGQKIKHLKKTVQGQNTVTQSLSLGDLPKGVYILEVKGNHYRETKKFIKE